MSETEEGRQNLFLRGWFYFFGGNLGARSAYRVHLIGVGGVPDGGGPLPSDNACDDLPITGGK
jgi:hypothetical protein